MFSKHVDVVAIFAISVGLLAASEVRNAFTIPGDAIRIQNGIVSIHASPLASQFVDHLIHFCGR